MISPRPAIAFPCRSASAFRPMKILPLLFTSLALALSPLLSAGEILVKKGESVAFLGDSITQQGAGSSGGYVRLVASGLAAQGVEISVIPAGISGHKSNQMLDRLEKDVLSKKPTWMTLSWGVNDVWHQARGEGVLLEDYKKNITAILDRCQQAGVKVVVLTATQIKLPVTNPENTKLAAYNAFLRETAQARSLPLADLNAAMAAEQAALEKAGIQRVLTTDGVHMNLYGNLMMAKGVLSAFGLDEQQLAVANAKWSEIPDLYQGAAKIKLSLKELAALETYAASQKKSVDALISDLTAEAVKAALKAAPAK
jgi:lysophospholipase L1-like esterase